MIVIMKHWKFNINPIFVFGLMIFFFLLISFPHNRSESDDGYFYAFEVSHKSYQALFYPRYLLFLPIMKLGYTVAEWFLPGLDAYKFMCVANSLCATVCVLLFFRILRKQGLQKKAAIFTTCILLFSYGFWRYAIEAEVYALSILLLLLVIDLLFEADKKVTTKIGAIILAAVLAALSILIYKPNIIVVGFSFGLVMLIGKNWKQFFLYGTLQAFIVLLGYYIVFQLFADKISGFITFLLEGSSRSQGSTLMSLFVVGSNFTSMNFIYGLPFITEFIHHHFPSNLIVEEVFAARRNHGLSLLSTLTFLLLICTSCFIVWRAIRKVKLNAVLKNPFALWALLYSIMLLVLDPTSPEPWIMVIVPFMAIVGASIIKIYLERFDWRMILVLIILLATHNIIGGVSFIWKKSTDYSAYESGWLVRHAKQNDLVLSFGSASTLRYILYYVPAELCSPEQKFGECILKIKRNFANGGSVYFLEDMMHPSETIRYRHKKAYDEVAEFISRNRNNFRVMNEGEPEEAIIYKLMHLNTDK